MRVLLIGVVMSLLLLGGDVAQASAPLDVSAAVRVAEGYWSASTCEPVRVDVVPSSVLNPDPESADLALGAAWSELCLIRVADWVLPDRPWACTVLVHEYGHLLGFDHDSDDPVMAERSGTPIRPCVLAFGKGPCRPRTTARKWRNCQRHRRELRLLARNA